MKTSLKNQLSERLAHPKRKSKGFALVATLSLLILLAILAVGLLSLSSVTLRTANQGSAQAEARANARMALMVAIGELQKHMGPDQRISANGSILSDSSVNHPHWTGAWDSWHAGPSSAGDDETSEHSTLTGASNPGMAPSYEEGRNDHFRSWLLSLGPGEASSWEAAKDLPLAGLPMPTKDETAIRLVGAGSLGTDATADFVSARLLPLKKNPTDTVPSGRYGWWVGDESQKARIMADSYETVSEPLTTAENVFRAQAPGSMGNTTLPGLEGMTNETQLGGLPSLKSLDLVSVNPAPAAGTAGVSQRTSTTQPSTAMACSPTFAKAGSNATSTPCWNARSC